MLLRHTGECERWKCLEGCVHPGWIEHDVNILYKNKPKKCCKHVNIKMNLSDVCLNHMSWCFVTFGLSPGEQSKGWVAKSSKREVWGARRKEMGMASGGGSQDARTFRHRHRKHPRQRKAREQDVFFPFSNKQTCLLFYVLLLFVWTQCCLESLKSLAIIILGVPAL